MSMDVLLLDECGQLSAQQLSVMDVVLRHMRENDLPFGGLLVIGSFDHKQLDAIDGLPFLLNHQIISDFTVVKLDHSVRAAEDENLQVCSRMSVTVHWFHVNDTEFFVNSFMQKIQKITRESPFSLMGNEAKFEEFYNLIVDNIAFCDSMEKLPPNTQRMYHRRKAAHGALKEFVDNTVQYLVDTQTPHVVSHSLDFKKYSTSNSNMVKINEGTEAHLISTLDNKAKEGQRLVFFEGAIFEATMNDRKSGVVNTQTLLMLDVPSPQDVRDKKKIKLYAAKPGSSPPDRLFYADPPSKKEVVDEWGWKEVQLDVVPETFHNAGGVRLYRQQYPLTHPGASTVRYCTVCY